MAAIATIMMVALTALAVGCNIMPPAPTTAPTPASSPSAPQMELTRLEPMATAGWSPLPTETPSPASPSSTPQIEAPKPETPPITRTFQSFAQDGTPPPAPLMETLTLEPVLVDRRFKSPTNLVQAKDGQVWVTEQAGSVWVFDEPELDDATVTEAMDITGRVNSRGSEEGLLGLASDPKTEGHLYIYYSAANPRRSVVSRFTVSPHDSSVDPGSELVILEVEQPYANHNGGQLAFGPDGYLYIGLGDGGAAGDPRGNGQDTLTLLGAILRIDISQATPERPYTIPPDNPFANGGGRGEIWAYGLRNPWRFSFDSETGELWAGDVGQNRWEEIDLIVRGSNYGWNVLEGDHCFGTRGACERQGIVPPVWEYSLDGEPCSVIGGYVYRGTAIPWLNGVYVYGDFCSGQVFGLRYVDGTAIEHKQLIDTDLRIVSFAPGDNGEIYLLSQKSGIYRLTDE